MKSVFIMKTLFSALVVWLVMLMPNGWCGEVSAARTLTAENTPSEGKTCEITMTLHKDGRIVFNWATLDKSRRIPGPGFTIYESQVQETEALLKKAYDWLRIARENDVLPFNKVIGEFNHNTVLFSYENDKERTAHLWTFDVNVDTVPAFLKMLQQYPDAKKELDEKLAQSAKESELFK
jgi:hypothetical protein